MCLIQAGRITHQQALESIKNFGQYVIPYFKKRSGEQAAAPSRA
jgi:hypothetical protein